MSRYHESIATITVVSIATNIYFEYWKQLVLSADNNTASDMEITFFVFSDVDEATFNSFQNQIQNFKLKLIPIKNLGWPAATLRRYELIFTHKDLFKGQIFVYMDADMLLVANPWYRILERVSSACVVLVKHPGYYRPKGLQRLRLYKANPSFIFKDLKSLVLYGALGTWETSRRSEAFTPRFARRVYLCGGIWFGSRGEVFDLCEKLAAQVHVDTARQVLAKWHDESYLNAWAAKNQFEIENPELCFDLNAPNLFGLSPMIVAVRKNLQTRVSLES